jgi:hypothetical protein
MRTGSNRKGSRRTGSRRTGSMRTGSKWTGRRTGSRRTGSRRTRGRKTGSRKTIYRRLEIGKSGSWEDRSRKDRKQIRPKAGRQEALKNTKHGRQSQEGVEQEDKQAI